MLGVLLELSDADTVGGDGSSPKKKGGKKAQQGGGRLSYFLNGQPLGVAFEGLPLSSKGAGEEDARIPTLVRYYPAISLDEGEALRVNIGTRPFAFPECMPAGAKPVAAALSEPADEPATAAATPAGSGASATTDGAKTKGKAAAAAAAAASQPSPSQPPPAAAAGGDGGKKKAPPPPKRDVAPEALDLSGFAAPEELEVR